MKSSDIYRTRKKKKSPLKKFFISIFIILLIVMAGTAAGFAGAVHGRSSLMSAKPCSLMHRPRFLTSRDG
jgi:flagellar basal body-associated protein FliL